MVGLAVMEERGCLGWCQGVWPPVVGKRPCGGCDSRPPRECLPAPAPSCAQHQSWGRAWHHQDSKLHFLVGSDKALVTVSCESPGVGMCVACMPTEGG